MLKDIDMWNVVGLIMAPFMCTLLHCQITPYLWHEKIDKWYVVTVHNGSFYVLSISSSNHSMAFSEVNISAQEYKLDLIPLPPSKWPLLCAL